MIEKEGATCSDASTKDSTTDTGQKCCEFGRHNFLANSVITQPVGFLGDTRPVGYRGANSSGPEARSSAGRVMSGSNRGADGGQAGTRGQAAVGAAAPRSARSLLPPVAVAACRREKRPAPRSKLRPAMAAASRTHSGPPSFLAAAFSGARKWRPGCSAGFPGSCLHRPGVPAVLPRIRFISPGSPGSSSPDPVHIARESRRVFPDPVYIARESRRFFPGPGLYRPGVPAVLSRIRFEPSGHRRRAAPAPRTAPLSSGRMRAARTRSRRHTLRGFT